VTAHTTDTKPSACAYYCRHYLQRDPSTEPPRRGTGANIDYLIYGIFFAEHGSFSIAFACPEMEEELADAVRRPEGFDQICSQIPALAKWTSRAEPTSRVLGGASLANRWHQYPEARKNVVLGLFPVGDSHIQTNPLYGRGCSMALVQVAALGPGQFFGEMALLFKQPRSATVKCATGCSLFSLGNTDLKRIMRKNPSVGKQLRKIAEQRRLELEQMS
jgi:CRP-like cAMP-binding protein